MKTTLIYTLALFAIALHGQGEIESSFTEIIFFGKWSPAGENKYEYDSDKNLTLDTFNRYNPISQSMTKNVRTSYSYNTNNMAVEKIMQTWQEDKYINYSKEIYGYENDIVTSILYQEYENDTWKDKSKEVVTYDTDNKLIGTLTKVYDGSGVWTNSTKGTDSYLDGYITESKEETWKDSKWENLSLYEFKYNSNNEQIEYLEKTWDPDATPPSYSEEDEEKTKYVIKDGNLEQLTYEFIGGIIRARINYHTTSLLSSFSHPFKDKTGLDYRYQDFPYVNSILSQTKSDYNPEDGSYFEWNRITYNYSSSLSLSDNVFNKKISLYPNPTVGYIKLNGLTKESNISIYNLLGSKIIEKTIQLNEEIDVQNLTKGIYFLKIENGSTLKFVKK